MSDLPWAPPPIDSEPVSLDPPRHVRPWWGLGDVLLGGPFIVAVAFVGALMGLAFVNDRGALLDEGVELPMAVLVLSLLAQQIGQGGWPVLVSRWKGLGPVADWRLRIRWYDPLLGIVAAVAALVLASVVALVVSGVVGLDDPADAENTQFLSDAEGTLWLFPLLAAVLIGAPLAEELFFRGLVLRAFEKRVGTVWAVVGSTVVFALPHYTGADWRASVVLLASISAVGAILGAVTVLTDRLWPAITAHVLFNAVGAATALGSFDQLGSGS